MYEQASERWSPVQSVEKVILSVISMLAGESTPTFNSMASICKPSRHLPTVFTSISLPLSFHQHCRPRHGKAWRTRCDAHLTFLFFHPVFSPPDYLLLVFTHLTSRLPLLVSDILYPILAYPASWHTNSEPNLESGANIDCCKLYRDDRPVSVISYFPVLSLAGSSSF